MNQIKLTKPQELVVQWAKSDCNFLAILNGSGAGNTFAAEQIKQHFRNKRVAILDGISAINNYLSKEGKFFQQINYIIICRPQEFLTFADKIRGKYTVISGYSLSDNPYLDDNYKRAILDVFSKKNWKDWKD